MPGETYLQDGGEWKLCSDVDNGLEVSGLLMW